MNCRICEWLYCINHKEPFGERIIEIGQFLQVATLNFTFTQICITYADNIIA